MPFIDCLGVGCVTLGRTISATGIYEAIFLGTECRTGTVSKDLLYNEATNRLAE
jgi:hypothetical protein